MPNRNEQNLSALENFVLSGIAAIGAKTAAAPVERIKLLIQNQNEMIKSKRLAHAYKSSFDCTKRVLFEEGVLSFWRGNLANCLRYLPSQALNFMFKERIKQNFNISPNDSSFMKLSKNTLSGGFAGVLSLTMVYSLDYTRTRLANDIISHSSQQKRQFNGLWDVYKQTYKTDGLLGFYRGFILSCWAIMVYRGIYFGVYDTSKPMLFADIDKSSHFFKSFLLGFAITTFAGIVVYPMDTIRRRMMMRSTEMIKYNGSIDCFKQIVKSEGPKSLYKGCVVNIFRNISGAGTLAGFDLMKRCYERYIDINQSDLNRHQH